MENKDKELTLFFASLAREKLKCVDGMEHSSTVKVDGDKRICPRCGKDVINKPLRGIAEWCWHEDYERDFSSSKFKDKLSRPCKNCNTMYYKNPTFTIEKIVETLQVLGVLDKFKFHLLCLYSNEAYRDSNSRTIDEYGVDDLFHVAWDTTALAEVVLEWKEARGWKKKISLSKQGK